MSDYNVDYSYAAIFQTRVLKTQSLLLDLLLILILVYFVYRFILFYLKDKIYLKKTKSCQNFHNRQIGNILCSMQN